DPMARSIDEKRESALPHGAAFVEGPMDNAGIGLLCIANHASRVVLVMARRHTAPFVSGETSPRAASYSSANRRLHEPQ
ncbi:hypothetical protein V5F44_21040, partial [Xanthobacter sp. V2C-8]|uniref:hypothetical protein n=1 Tax=Xanthobacter albus TaxID=3119929 RepID=UPI00372B842A